MLISELHSTNLKISNNTVTSKLEKLHVKKKEL